MQCKKKKSMQIDICIVSEISNSAQIQNRTLFCMISRSSEWTDG